VQDDFVPRLFTYLSEAIIISPDTSLYASWRTLLTMLSLSSSLLYAFYAALRDDLDHTTYAHYEMACLQNPDL